MLKGGPEQNFSAFKATRQAKMHDAVFNKSVVTLFFLCQKVYTALRDEASNVLMISEIRRAVTKGSKGAFELDRSLELEARMFQERLCFLLLKAISRING